jgi:hypothetical protein
LSVALSTTALSVLSTTAATSFLCRSIGTDIVYCHRTVFALIGYTFSTSYRGKEVMPMPGWLTIAAAIVTVVAGVVAVAEAVDRLAKRLRQKRKKR